MGSSDRRVKLDIGNIAAAWRGLFCVLVFGAPFPPKRLEASLQCEDGFIKRCATLLKEIFRGIFLIV